MLKTYLKALRLESEISLNYLYKHQFKKLTQLGSTVVRGKGFFFRSASFIRLSLRSLSRFSNTQLIPCTFFFFAGTNNQLTSLLPIVEEVKRQGVSSLSLILPKLQPLDQKNFLTFNISLNQFFKIMILFFLKGYSLYRKLKTVDPEIAKNSFNKFAEVYLYLPYFLDALEKSRPSFVVMSNDHNTPNRCLRLAAQYLNIKTVYLQHASVSNLFPPLGFDYSFLDGLASAKIYGNCEGNLVNPKVDGRVVFLSGMSKKLVANRPVFQKKIGIAVNTLDQFEKLTHLCESLLQKGVFIRVRVHPAQSKEFISRLERFISENPVKLSISRPNEESLGDFFSVCFLMISGNSSIHLEAALVGVMTYYYEFSDNVEHPDYYGYVKSGISLALPDTARMNDSEIKNMEKSPVSREKAIKFYAESYKTKWQGREGELIAKTLINLQRNEIDQGVWRETEIEGFSNILAYRLKEEV